MRSLLALLCTLIPACAWAAAPPAAQVENSLGMTFVRIPAGSFQMGSDETPEALADVIQKELPGFGEEMRRASLAEGVPTAILSRQTAVIRKQALIVLFPKFDPDLVLEVMKKHPATFLPLVPPIADRLLAASNASHRTKDDVVTDRKVATFYPDDGRSNG